MLKFIKSFFGKKPEAAVAEAPYKVEAPASTVSEQAVQAVVESIAPAKPKTAKKPAAKKVSKPKAPRKPKAPKAS